MMITPTLDDAFCSDIPNIEDWVPPLGSPIDFWLQLDIGPEGEEGTDQFQLRVVSPDAVLPDAPRIDRATLLVNRTNYSYEAIEHAIGEVLVKCARATWPETALALSRFFLWEYEDYTTVAD